MTPQQALQLLDNVSSQVSLSRQDHVKIQEAVQTLQVAIGPSEQQVRTVPKTTDRQKGKGEAIDNPGSAD